MSDFPKTVKLSGGPRDGDLITVEEIPLVIERRVVREGGPPLREEAEYRPSSYGDQIWTFRGWRDAKD